MTGLLLQPICLGANRDNVCPEAIDDRYETTVGGRGEGRGLDSDRDGTSTLQKLELVIASLYVLSKCS